MKQAIINTFQVVNRAARTGPQQGDTRVPSGPEVSYCTPTVALPYPVIYNVATMTASYHIPSVFLNPLHSLH